MVIRTGRNRFIAAGADCELRLIRRDGTLEFAWIEDGEFREGQWQPRRRLNGDEGGRMIFGSQPSIRRFELLDPAAGAQPTGENVIPYEPMT